MVNLDLIQIENSWKEILKDEFDKPYFAQIQDFLVKERESGNIVYPESENIFVAFNQTPWDNVKVVILWQDPYHGEGEAHGLCFSVQDGVKQPPSLRNIFKELESDLWISRPVSGDLTPWSKQGVFLLNASLTVRKDTPNSHKDIGWLNFTDAVIKKLSDDKSGLIFVLWWAYAQGKEELIDNSKHHIIMSTHPSPFSSYRWFFWSKPFSKINEILEKDGKDVIDWKI